MFNKKQHKIGEYFVDARRTGVKGRAIILIHGIGVSGNYFLPFARVLSRNFDVHVLDMPGYGETPNPSHPLAPFEQADIVAGYMKAIGLTAAIMIGQSMGCQTAAQVALRHPSLCEKLVLIGPTVNKWERQLPAQMFRLMCDGFVEPLKMNFIILHDYIHTGLPSYLVTLRHMFADHIEETLKQVDVPVCIVRGARDGIAPKKWVEYLGKIPKSCEVHHVKGGPHNVQFTRAEGLFAACENFLRK